MSKNGDFFQIYLKTFFWKLRKIGVCTGGTNGKLYDGNGSGRVCQIVSNVYSAFDNEQGNPLLQD